MSPSKIQKYVSSLRVCAKFAGQEKSAGQVISLGVTPSCQGAHTTRSLCEAHSAAAIYHSHIEFPFALRDHDLTINTPYPSNAAPRCRSWSLD